MDEMCSCEAPQLEVRERGAVEAKEVTRPIAAERQCDAQDRDSERCPETRGPCARAGIVNHDSSVTLIAGRVCYLRRLGS
jgi:hypothetical protein